MAGNPLALIEFAGELTAEQRVGWRLLPDPLPVGASLRGRFVGRAAGLTPAPQMLALLAAAELSGDPALSWRAAADLGVHSEDPALAELDSLLSLTPRVAFRHPLIRSAIYFGAPVDRRRRAHAALARAIDDFDADRRGWHLAAAAVAPNEAVAAELERGARRAHRRSGYSASAAFLERAARHTPAEERLDLFGVQEAHIGGWSRRATASGRA